MRSLQSFSNHRKNVLDEMPLILLFFDETRLSTSASALWSLIPGHKDQKLFDIRDQGIFPEFAALT